MALPDILEKNLRLPVVASPLFIISYPPLVLAQCKAGVVGSFPALNARPEAQLDEWLAEVTEDLAAHDAEHPDRPAAPFAVNQIVHKLNGRLEHDLSLCMKYRCRSASRRSARSRRSTRRCIPMAASCCTTSSTTAMHGKRSKKAPTD
jgi:NAD(P)H-dependent flavin oxidoreductase YrpB (nitropropane dioxygenase family)